MEVKPRVAIVGSMNVDVFLRMQRMPALGETLASKQMEKAFGGKGANQAVACARLGAQAAMLAQVGGDQEGRDYVSFMQEEGIDTSGIRQLADTPTGMAFILSQFNGENAIVINGGANMAYSEQQGAQLDEAWGEAISYCNVLLLQREIPESMNLLAARKAKSVQTHEVVVILDMGGRDDPLSDELVALCDIVSPNQTETVRLLKGNRLRGDSLREEEIQNDLLDKDLDQQPAGSQSLMIQESGIEKSKVIAMLRAEKPGLKLLLKQGGQGSTIVWLDENSEDGLMQLHVPAVSFADHPGLQLVDTTGAGDTFTAAFAVRLSEFSLARQAGETLTSEQYQECMKFASQAAFLCICKLGTTPAIPRRTEVNGLVGGTVNQGAQMSL